MLAQTRPSSEPLELFGTRLIGITPENGRKLLITVCFVVGLLLFQWLLKWVANLFLRGYRSKRVIFWVRQGISALLSILILITILSIWFNSPDRLTTFMGLVTAGVAFALQTPITAIAGYLVILRGKTFGVGDRITMGGVRGDVIALGFIQTTIMEMGQPPDVQSDDPGMWVQARQYTGRIVTISNSKIFDEPVYNYTREFPYIWEEMRLPVSYKDDRGRAEQILLQAAQRHTVQVRDLSKEVLDELGRRYFLPPSDLEPKVYWRLTDNWLEMTVRFIAPAHGVRDLKSAMSREIIQALDEAKIGIASSTYDVVGMPPIRVQFEKQNGDSAPMQYSQPQHTEH